MTVKEKVLTFLLNAKGESLSGEEIARTLEVTRSAVWKAIQGLQKEGYQIEGVRNRGYRLLSDSDKLSVAAIQSHIEKYGGKFSIEIYEELPSTNQKLKELADKGAAEGKVILAEYQKEGKGQRGRDFYSPAETGLYMSILMRPEMVSKKAMLFTAAAATAAALSIEEIVGEETKIKWVNDIFLDGKKVCGILTEASFSMETGEADYLVVGIGINVYRPKEMFPGELQERAGVICQEQGKHIRNVLAATILQRLWEYYERLDEKTFYQDYKRRLFVLGRDILLCQKDGQVKAKALDLDEMCGLLVELEDGTKKTLRSGEISIRSERKEEEHL